MPKAMMLVLPKDYRDPLLIILEGDMRWPSASCADPCETIYLLMAPFPYTWKLLYLHVIFKSKLQFAGAFELLEFTISSFPIRIEKHTKKNPLKNASHVLQCRRI